MSIGSCVRVQPHGDVRRRSRANARIFTHACSVLPSPTPATSKRRAAGSSSCSSARPEGAPPDRPRQRPAERAAVQSDQPDLIPDGGICRACARCTGAWSTEQVRELVPVSHGNALSVYFHDPEGNRIELFVDTPWYVQQPLRLPMDMRLSDDELWAWAEARGEEAARLPAGRGVARRGARRMNSGTEHDLIGDGARTISRSPRSR